jgi:transposase
VVAGRQAFDRIRYRQRNRVERLMNRRKQFHAVATRYDTQSMMAAVGVGSSV